MTELSSHFHFSAVGGGKPGFAQTVNDFVDRYAVALKEHEKDDLLEMFAEGPEITWTDPVGAEPYVGLESIKGRKSKMPAMDHVKVLEVFYTLTPAVFLVKVE